MSVEILNNPDIVQTILESTDIVLLVAAIVLLGSFISLLGMVFFIRKEIKNTEIYQSGDFWIIQKD